MSPRNSRRQDSGCLNMDNRNIPDSEGQSRKEKPEMPEKTVAGVTVFGLGSQLMLNLSRAGGGNGAGGRSRNQAKCYPNSMQQQT